jgi:hypothetical protein
VEQDLLKVQIAIVRKLNIDSRYLAYDRVGDVSTIITTEPNRDLLQVAEMEIIQTGSANSVKIAFRYTLINYG